MSSRRRPRRGHVLEGADTGLVTRRREKHQPGLGSGNLQLDPPLPWPHWLIGGDLQSDFLRPECQRLVLVTNRNAYELDFLHHDERLLQSMRRLIVTAGLSHGRAAVETGDDDWASRRP